MRRASRVDANQHAVVKLLRRLGCVVETMHAAGRGFPDLVVGAPGLTLVGPFDRAEVLRQLEGISDLVVHDGANLLVEVKNPDVNGQLNERQKDWHARWRGQKAVAESPADAVALIRSLKV